MLKTNVRGAQNNHSDVCLGDIVERHVERCVDPISSGYDVFVGVDDMDPDDLHLRRVNKIEVNSLPPTFRFVFRKGMVLFPTRRPALRKCALAHRDGITGEKVLVLKSRNHDLLLPEFAPFLLASERVRHWSIERAIGSVTPHFRWGDLSRLSVRVPPTDMQRDAMPALYALDNTREAWRDALGSASLLRRALLSSTFRGEPGRKLVPLRDALACILSGGTPSRANGEFWRGSIPWLSPKDMKTSLLHETTEHVSDAGAAGGTTIAPSDTLFVVVRGMILAHTFPVCRAAQPMAFNQDIKGLVFRSEIDPKFAQAWLEWLAPQCLQMVSETSHGTKRLETDRLLALQFPMVSSSQQQALVRRLGLVDAAIDGIRERIARCTALEKQFVSQVLAEAQP
ncbi:type I restriction enzyme S subunit [Bradyrhizobium japonicum]